MAWSCLLAFAGSLVLCLSLTPVAARLAVRYGVLDRSAGELASAVPCLGGLAVVVAVTLASVPVAGWEVIGVLGCAAAVAAVGLVDDVRGLTPATRLVVETALALLLWHAGFGVEWVGGGLVGLTVTVLWIVGVTNAINLLDNMDGLAAGVAAAASVVFFVLGIATGQLLVAALSAALGGAALGFLRANTYPARIYLGDTGSLFVGLVLAVVGARLNIEALPYVPGLVLAVPIADTVLVTTTRLARGRSPFQGGTDHLSHRLLRLGLRVPAVVGLLWSASAALGALGLLVALAGQVG